MAAIDLKIPACRCNVKSFVTIEKVTSPCCGRPIETASFPICHVLPGHASLERACKSTTRITRHLDHHVSNKRYNQTVDGNTTSSTLCALNGNFRESPLRVPGVGADLPIVPAMEIRHRAKSELTLVFWNVVIAKHPTQNKDAKCHKQGCKVTCGKKGSELYPKSFVK